MINLEIKSADVKHFRKGSSAFEGNDGLRHVKVLPYLSIVQSVEGSYDITLGTGTTEHTGTGGFFIAPSGIEQTIIHRTDKASNKMRFRWVFIDVDINKAFKFDELYRFPTVVTDEGKSVLNDLFERLFATEDQWESYSVCYQLLGVLSRMGEPIERQENSGAEMAIAYMMEHYAESITVEKLASLANMSESNFYASFKRLTGSSPMAYLNHYRLSVAANLLLETDDTANRISYTVGIKDALYFSKLFKKTYGVSPRDYRRSHRNNTK